MSKNNIVILSLCLIILFVSGYFLYLSKTADSYYGVYLNTGDLYFGHLSSIPSLVMTDVYYIQQNQEDNTLGLQRFVDSVFNPESKITISRDKVVWITKLREDSQVIKVIKQGAIIPNNNQNE